MAMDAEQAREHLEMVDRILRQADERRYRPMGALYVAWGLGAALVEIAEQVARGGSPAGPLAIAGGIILFGSLLYTIAVSVLARRNASRIPASELRMGKVMGAVWLCIFVAALCQPHMFAGWAAAAIWNLGAAISMLVIGFFGDRRALFGAIVLLASILVANYWFVYPGFVLAGGFLVGYVAIGILYMIQNARSAPCE